MDIKKLQAFNEKMSKKKLNQHRHQRFAKGGVVRQNFLNGGAAASGALGGAAAGAAVGSVVPGIGTAIGAVGGALIGGLSGLFSGSGPQLPNITDPVTGQQITDAQGNVVATQAQLQQFSNTLNGVNGPANQQAVLGQLQGVANGTGPNPAQAELAQATGQNVSNQAALAASQRGASSNVGLLSRQAAQQGAAAQQTAVGQAATLQANQSLNALNSEGTIAGQQVSEQQGALTNANTAALNNQGQLLNAQGAYNTAETSGQGNVNSNNTSTVNSLIPEVGSLTNGALSGAGTSSIASGASNAASTGSSSLTLPALGSSAGYARGGRVVEGPHKSHVANFLAMKDGGKVKAMVSPGEIWLSPDKVERVIREGADPTKIGERIPGKAKVSGDSKKNDIVPRDLKEGGVVIPRHIATHKNAREKSELFVHKAVHMKKVGK